MNVEKRPTHSGEFIHSMTKSVEYKIHILRVFKAVETVTLPLRVRVGHSPGVHIVTVAVTLIP